jgi:hypothetical protein
MHRQFADDRTKSCMVYDAEAFSDHAGFLRAELSLSFDVLCRLVEDEVFDSYLRCLFDSAERYVIVYSTNETEPRLVLTSGTVTSSRGSAGNARRDTGPARRACRQDRRAGDGLLHVRAPLSRW